MRSISNKETYTISGALYGVCTAEDFDAPNYVTYNPKPQKTDPHLIFIEAANAALWGCTGAVVTGKGIPGCIIGGVLGATGKVMSMVMTDAYKLYEANKK